MATRKKRGARVGRPPKPSETVRHNRVATTLTDCELAELRAFAYARGVPVAAIIYELIVKALRRR